MDLPHNGESGGGKREGGSWYRVSWPVLPPVDPYRLRMRDLCVAQLLGGGAAGARLGLRRAEPAALG